MSESEESDEGENICGVCKSERYELTVCQKCNEDICVNCVVPNAVLYSHPLGKGKYKVCTICESYISNLEKFLTIESIQWCQNTSRGKIWLEKSGAKEWSALQLPIDAYIDVSLNPDDEEMIEKDVDTGRSDPDTHNWEVREALLRVITPSYKEDIKKVLRAYCVRNNKVGYCQGMNIVTVWLLLFFDHNNAFHMLCYLIEEWLLPDFYIGAKHGNSLNGFYIESTVIAGLLEHLMPSFKSSSITSNEFSEFFSLQHLIQLFVSTVDIETTAFLWDKLCEEGSIALIRGILSLMIISTKAINQGTHPLHILKMLNDNRLVNQVKEEYNRLKKEINETRVTRLRKLARDYRANQWQKCEKMILKKLEDVSHFTKIELETLQKEFNHIMKSRRGSLMNAFPNRRPTVQLPANLQQKMADYQGSNTVGISKKEFVELITQIAPSVVERGSQLFDHFDEDRSGYLDFRELTIEMSVLSKGYIEDKLRICYNAYDIDRSGYLQSVELQLLIEKILLPYTKEIEKDPESIEIKETIVKIHQKMMFLCETSNGKVSFSDFFNGIKADMLLYNCICEYLGTDKTEVNSIVKALNTGTFTAKVKKHGKTKCNLCLIM